MSTEIYSVWDLLDEPDFIALSSGEIKKRMQSMNPKSSDAEMIRFVLRLLKIERDRRKSLQQIVLGKP